MWCQLTALISICTAVVQALRRRCCWTFMFRFLQPNTQMPLTHHSTQFWRPSSHLFFFFFYKPIIFWSLMQHSFNSLKNPQLQPGWSFSENSENWFPVAALTGNQFLGFSILCGMIFSYCNIQKQLFSRHLWSITFPISRLSIGWHVAFSWMFRCHLLLWCLLDDAKWAVACGWDYF